MANPQWDTNLERTGDEHMSAGRPGPRTAPPSGTGILRVLVMVAAIIVGMLAFSALRDISALLALVVMIAIIIGGLLLYGSLW